MSELLHLVRRFLWSLRAHEPGAHEEAWLVGLLSPAEAALYNAQSQLDRAHSIDCALATRDMLGARASRPPIVASALHDVGKATAGLGTFGRAMATMIAAVTPRRALTSWSAESGLRGKVGRYARHDELGEEMLRDAGSHKTVVAWAREHHQPPSGWTIDAELGEVLRRADR